VRTASAAGDKHTRGKSRYAGHLENWVSRFANFCRFHFNKSQHPRTFAAHTANDGAAGLRSLSAFSAGNPPTSPALVAQTLVCASTALPKERTNGAVLTSKACGLSRLDFVARRLAPTRSLRYIDICQSPGWRNGRR
jgi:hypothetical protein